VSGNPFQKNSQEWKFPAIMLTEQLKISGKKTIFGPRLQEAFPGETGTNFHIQEAITRE